MKGENSNKEHFMLHIPNLILLEKDMIGIIRQYFSIKNSEIMLLTIYLYDTCNSWQYNSPFLECLASKSSHLGAQTKTNYVNIFQWHTTTLYQKSYKFGNVSGDPGTISYRICVPIYIHCCQKRQNKEGKKIEKNLY